MTLIVKIRIYTGYQHFVKKLLQEPLLFHRFYVTFSIYANKNKKAQSGPENTKHIIYLQEQTHKMRSYEYFLESVYDVRRYRNKLSKREESG